MPPFSYYGGKTALAQEIASRLPAHDHYVEPFAGSLAVLLAKPRSKQETVNDLDGGLVAFWRTLRDRPDELHRVATLTPHSREELALSAADSEDMDDLERARRVWVTLTQSRSHSMKGTGWWTRKKYAGTTPGEYLAAYAGRMPAAAARLAGVSLENRDALDVIRDYGTEPTACIYADPPYLGETRAVNYRLEFTAREQHEQFADACRSAKASVVVSGYASELYAEMFAGWHVDELKAPTALSGATDRVEVLWSNSAFGNGGLDIWGSDA